MTKVYERVSPIRMVLLSLLLIVGVSSGAMGQTSKATVTGVVVDSAGAVVKGAKVTVVNLGTKAERDTITSDDGAYFIPSLDPGEYKVSVEASGFKSAVREKVTLQTNDRLGLDFTLEIGVATEAITITSEAPLVETESSVRGDVITGRQVTDLPLAQRNFTLLAGITPGVTRPVVGILGGGGNFASGGPGNSTESTRFRESGGSVIAANGARVTNNNFTLDGIDNNETQFGQIAIFPDNDAIKEFKVEASVPSAESGRAGGAIISTTFKSGTNGLHGTLREFYQGRFGSARPANNPNPPNYVLHNFGGTIGGPMFLPRFGQGGSPIFDGRNKAFFFVSYNGQRSGTPAFGGGEFPFVTVPTVKMRNGDFSELLDRTQNVTFNTVAGPVVAPRGTIFDANGRPFTNNVIPAGLLSNAGKALFNAYPLPTEPGLVNNYRRNRAEKANADSYDIKFDVNFSSMNTFFARYSNSENVRIRDNNFPIGSSPNNNDLPSGFGAGEEFGNTRQVALGDTHTFSPTVINDLRAGYSRVEIGINNPGINGALGFNPNFSASLGIPNVNVCGTCEGVVLLGVVDPDRSLEFVGDGGPFYFKSNNFHVLDTLTVVKGNHLMKFGGDLRLRQNTNFDGGRNGGIKGNVQFGTSVGGFVSGNYSGVLGLDDAGSGYANVMLGYTPGFITRGTPGGPYLQSNKEIAFFVQDDWKVTKDLTLNLGMRYDVYTYPTERYNRQANFNQGPNNLALATDNDRALVNTDLNNLAPRIGFAYSGFRPDKRVVLRGGYGIVYTTDVSGVQPLTANPPNGANYSCNLNQYGTPACPVLPKRFSLDSGYPFAPEVRPTGTSIAVPGGARVFYVNPGIKTAYYHQWNLTYQNEFATNWVMEMAYVGSAGRNLLTVRNIGDSQGDGPGSRQILGIGQVITTDSLGRSNYNALQSKLEKRFSKGLSILSTYTWAHGLDNSPGGFAALSLGPNRYGFQNPLQPELDYGNSDLDVRHRWTFASTWDIPIGRGRALGGEMPKALDYIIGGLQINNVVTVQSGPVYTVTANGPRPDLIGDPKPTAAQEAAGFYFNPAAFATPTRRVFPNLADSAVFGSLGRNTFRGDGQEYWDAAIFKIFKIWEGSEMQVRVQAYNVLNHVNRFAPANNLNDNNAGRDLNLQKPRQLEFALRFVF